MTADNIFNEIIKGSILRLLDFKNNIIIVKEITFNINEGYTIHYYNTPKLNQYINIGGTIDNILLVVKPEPSRLPLDVLYDYYHIDQYICKYKGQSCRIIDTYYDATMDCYWCTLITGELNRYSFSFDSAWQLLEMVQVTNIPLANYQISNENRGCFSR